MVQTMDWVIMDNSTFKNMITKYMLHLYDQRTFIYTFSLEALDPTQEDWTHYTEVDLLPEVKHTKQKFDVDANKWVYVETLAEPGSTTQVFDEILTYEDARLRDYPKMEDYVDGVVKSNDAQVAEYINKCNEVKAMWPKDMEPITLREYYSRKGIEIERL